MWGHTLCQPLSCLVCQPGPCLSTRLPISILPTCLDECVFFNSLVVGLPYSLVFGQFCFVFFFLIVVVLLLVVRGENSVSTYTSTLAGSLSFFLVRRGNMCLFRHSPTISQLLTHSVLWNPFHSSRNPPTLCSHVHVLNSLLLIPKKKKLYCLLYFLEFTVVFLFFLPSLPLLHFEVFLNRVPFFSWKPKSSSPGCPVPMWMGS